MKKLNISRVVWFLGLLFSFIFMTHNTFASETPTHVDFTISYIDNAQKVEGAEFSVYKIGVIDDKNNLVLTEAFKDYPVNLTNVNSTDWNEYANTLKAYVKRDSVKPTATGKTDADGIQRFKLEKGLYLVVGEDLVLNNYRYKTNPFIVALPEFDKTKGEYRYTVASRPKFNKEELPKEEISIKVLKVWDDKNYENKRPESIEVELLENGQVKDTVTLSQKNNWRHTWDKLDPKSSWSVVEKNISKENYTVHIQEDGYSFVITNSYVPPKIPPKPPKTPPGIPLTGQLWWPVYLLSGIGSMSILLGFMVEKRKGDRNEE